MALLTVWWLQHNACIAQICDIIVTSICYVHPICICRMSLDVHPKMP